MYVYTKLLVNNHDVTYPLEWFHGGLCERTHLTVELLAKCDGQILDLWGHLLLVHYQHIDVTVK